MKNVFTGIFILSILLLVQLGSAEEFGVNSVTAARLLLTIDEIKKSEDKYNEKARLVASRIMDQYKGLPKSIYMRRRIRSQSNSLKFDSAVDEIEHVAKLLKDKGKNSQAVDLLDLALALEPSRVDLAYMRRESKLSRSADSSSGLYSIAVGSGSDALSKIEGLAKQQSLVKGLLVSQVRGSRFAGIASQMNATVVNHQADQTQLKVAYNQKVGSTMNEAIDHMLEYLQQRHQKLPNSVEVEFAFENQYIPKDGPSAGVACTLMIEALIKGYEYNPNFAVTGALDSEGKVGGVGGVPAKIRGAISRGCEIVAIPSENETVIPDMILMDSLSTLVKIQVIEIEKFDDALNLARITAHLEQDTRTALAEYKQVMDVVNRSGFSYLNNPQVQEKLRKVLELMPNHLSAKYLLLKAVNRNPKKLTLLGSVRAIDQESYSMVEEIQSGGFKVEDNLKVDKFGMTMSGLKRLRPLLEKRTLPYCDAIIEFTSHVRTAVNSPPKSSGGRSELSNKIDSSRKAIRYEYKNLFERADVKKDLLIDD